MVALVLLPFVGGVVDKYNKKIVIVIAQLFSIVSLILYASSVKCVVAFRIALMEEVKLLFKQIHC